MSELIQPYPSWVLNEQGEWEAPIEYPTDDGAYIWDEQNQAWIDESSPDWSRVADCD
jgi:hypothetical protein